MLGRLAIQSNRLTGSIPPELGNLSNLGTLELSRNQLSGSIPPELGNLSNLRRLYIESNNLSGSIPPELGNLSILDDLRIGRNRLSGSIPAELGNLSLQILILNDNELSGDVSALGNLSDTIRGEQFFNISGNGCFTADLETAAFLATVDPDWEDGCF